MASIYEIISYNDHERNLTSLERFTLREAGDVASEIVLETGNFSPYCLHQDSRQLIFVDLPDDIDLTRVPFVWYDQKRWARRLIGISYDELEDLTAGIGLPEKTILIHNPGRSGSTLLSQILNRVEDVRSFSEPQLFANFIAPAYRHTNRPELTRLLGQCIKLFARPWPDRTIAIKFGANCLGIASLFEACLPCVKQLFLYRNAIDYLASWKRINVRRGMTEHSLDDLTDFYIKMYGHSSFTDGVYSRDAPAVPTHVAWLAYWLFCVDSYYRTYEDGTPIFALRYEDLVGARQSVLERLFERLALCRDQVAAALGGFEGDAQAGTDLAREHSEGNQLKLRMKELKDVKTIIARHRPGLGADTILPATLMP